MSRRLEGAGRNTMIVVFHVDVVNLLTSKRYSIDFCGMSRSPAVSSREGIGLRCGANGLTGVTKRPVVSHRSCLKISSCRVGVVSGINGKGQSHSSDGYSPASHREVPRSIPGQSTWGVWWAVSLAQRRSTSGFPCQHFTSATYSLSSTDVVYS